MKDSTRNILLVIVIICIVGAIWYLDKGKVNPGGAVGGGVVASSTTAVHSADYAANAKQYPAAKELISPDGYINTGGQPVTISSLLGKKVILLDFWTYSCINCQRTIPYLNAWYQKYKDAGLEIIGIHTPEFDFEKVYANVAAAVDKFGIKYPVVMDSNYYTWNEYNNEYWPEEYLIDVDGLVRENNIGEGNYAETEQTIQKLLAQLDTTLGTTTANIPTGLVNINETINANSPETYFDYQRNTNLGNGTAGVEGVQTFTTPSAIDPDTLYLGGTWNIEDQFAENSEAGDTITFKYDAQDVYFVASSVPGVTITVLRDGVPVTTEAGSDLNAQSQVNIKEPRLYHLITEQTPGTHTLKIIVNGPKLDAYTFTFG